MRRMLTLLKRHIGIKMFINKPCTRYQYVLKDIFNVFQMSGPKHFDYSFFILSHFTSGVSSGYVKNVAIGTHKTI